MDTLTRINQFREETRIELLSIIDLIGVNMKYFYAWTESQLKYPGVEIQVKAFLDGDGARLLDIAKKLKNKPKDRIGLHKQRADIFKKARIYRAAKQRVPSPVN